MSVFAIPTPIFLMLCITTFAGAGLAKHRALKGALLAAGCALALAGLSGLLG
jgi:hypothetical protein